VSADVRPARHHPRTGTKHRDYARRVQQGARGGMCPGPMPVTAPHRIRLSKPVAQTRQNKESSVF